jgi:N-acetylneuraminate lyase
MLHSLRLTGLIAAPFTPFHPEGSLNPDVIAPYAEFLIGTGVRGVFVCGSTGEGHSLSIEERRIVAEHWVSAVRRRIPVMIHVGHNSIVEARTLAAHAKHIGADAIAALAPSYYKPRTIADLIEFLAPVAAAAPGLPFYFYHIPSMTGVTLPVPELLREGRKQIPTLNGLKFTHNDMMELQECLAVDNGAFDVVFGFDEMLLAGLTLGCRGAVGSTYNFAAATYLRLISAFEKGDLAAARKEQLRSVKMIRLLLSTGFMRAGKAIMGLLGVNCGPVRAPLTPITAEEATRLGQRLAELEVLVGPR